MAIRKTSVLREGFQGVLYPVNHRKDKIIITLSGSDGGLRFAKKMARFHQKQGMPALAAGYFGTKETKKALSQIPLEYIENAVTWLQQQGYKRIAVEGYSKGAEYALAAAAAFQTISCVILKTPSWFYGEGLMKKAPSNTSCWTYRKKELPYTPYQKRSFHILKSILRAKEYNIFSINDGKQILAPSIIPVEKVNGPILIFSTKSDTVWPSAESGEKLDFRLTHFHYPYPHKHVCFDYMSHFMFEKSYPIIRFLFKSERNYPKECAEERKHMEHEIINWLEHVW